MLQTPSQTSAPPLLGDTLGLRNLPSLVSIHAPVRGALESMEPLLPLLKLKGKTYSLADHFPMKPLFNINVPQRTILKCARQISKSTTLSARDVLRGLTNPHLQVLVVTPRFDQARRLSNLNFKAFIETSPARRLMVDKNSTAAVLQRDLANSATFFFSYAFLSPDRCRGFSVDCIDYDEVQDLSYDFIPVINEAMSASKIAVETYSGTPKTLDNGIQALWEKSSQAEWVTPCSHCGYHNVASVHFDLLKMIGLRGVVCAKCSQSINPRDGHWKHMIDEREHTFAGYHIPQVILPMHYDNPRKWRDLLYKRDGGGGYSPARFQNEVLGESCDVGTKLITLTELRSACILPTENTFDSAIKQIRKYAVRIMGIDWGGGGADQTSFTTIAILGRHPTTKQLECIYGKRLHASVSHIEEVKEILELVKHLQVNYVAHDYGGSGSSREALLIQAGLPIEKLIPFNYVGAIAKDMIVFHDATSESSRRYYSLDKAKSLVLLTACIKTGFVLFPKYETCKGVVDDFLALVEEKREMLHRSDLYVIRRSAQLPDDFVHSVNFASAGLWHIHQEYPNIGKILNQKAYTSPAVGIPVQTAAGRSHPTKEER